MKKLVVIGGGAAGFFCAVNAARMNSQLKVVVLEKTNKLLSKVRVSGGGRCNVTHACFSVPDLVKKYPRGTNFLKKTFQQFNTNHAVQWFQERGVRLKTEADGRMFSVTDSSQTIIDCLLKEANRYGVEVLMNSDVQHIIPIRQPVTAESAATSDSNEPKGFVIGLSNQRTLTAHYICVACGGYPKSTMFDWLVALGHTFENPVPSLFTFNIPGNSITALMGISIENVALKTVGSKLTGQGPVLITHWGLSGPAVLRLSAWGAREFAEKNYRFTLLVNWLPQYNEHTLRQGWQTLRNNMASQKVMNKNPFELPSRLWHHLVTISGIHSDTRWAELPAKEQNRLIKNLLSCEFEVNGKTTFKEEFVTCGGIHLGEIDANTMESKIVPGVYFAGEIMDVDGITGGFNFQHAWTSGWIAAKSIADNSIGVQ